MSDYAHISHKLNLNKIKIYKSHKLNIFYPSFCNNFFLKMIIIYHYDSDVILQQ